MDEDTDCYPALLKAMKQRKLQHLYQATQKGEDESNIWLYILFLFLAEGSIEFSLLKFQAKKVKAKRQSYMGRFFYRKWGSMNCFDVTDCLTIFLLWCNSMTEASWGENCLFGSHFNITVHGWRKLGQKLKQGRNAWRQKLMLAGLFLMACSDFS